MIFEKIYENFKELKEGNKKLIKEGLIDKDEALELYKIDKWRDYLKLFDIASRVRDYFKKEIEITSTIHITNICKVNPKCLYCGFAAGTSKEGYYKPFRLSDEEIKKSAIAIEESGIKRVSCSSAHGYEGKEVLRALKIVKENTNLEVLVNAGADLTEKSIKELKKYGIDTICCNLETINENLFKKVKPGEELEDRIRVCKLVNKYNIELSSGLLIGIGESYEDRVEHLFYLKNELVVGEIPIMGFNPYKGTPMENHPKCSALEQAKTIAITRLLFPNIRITSPTPTIGSELVQFALLGGASNVATVIPRNHPINIKGVGNPKTGNLEDVVKMIVDLGLKPKLDWKKYEEYLEKYGNKMIVEI
ncbi:5,10-methenyltetrahydromethanopterin hydrogenase cofactor biosynthesis protein HmdB [Methanocaldococcus sp.]|uniref:5,10-methenyltetrahydromethanopterin hydrogenase cofactor biosynthesis protein HmdB n=1 Tax=Methanocaldococcus sp. TaxID=2152917 RepID=UPI00263771AE|nr:5,10-methenyltetrahydromethanopterin hydrogenase cofactor biosynthesis protein HmdB [Methanocaldococcus sp.]MCQ6254209.1 5,10-methenyltetrahydromethanopterin hydrogenase cofactor biosynthesis protein HmdB [Methanocaldococcus sp.]